MVKKNLNNYFGYIEGYYGKLLTWNNRKSIIEKLKQNRMNCYLYAPKEDIYHRFLWRKPFDNDWVCQFKKFCKFSKKNNILILAGISPGLDFNFKSTYSFNKDLKILKEKCFKLLDLGADKIVLLLDDIPNDFNKRFKKLREGFEHAKLCNQLNYNFKNNLLVVPRIYSDELINESKDYLELFLGNLDDYIPIFYTGEYIVSHKHKSKNSFINKQIKNKNILFWDNFYANDYCPHKLYTGWPKFNPKNDVLFNLTGMINTDKLLIDIIGSYKTSPKNKILKEIFANHGIPKAFLKIFNFFNEPINSNNIKINEFKNNEKLIYHIDKLLWKWKSPLSREWYPFLFRLKTDLQIYSQTLGLEKIIKTQTLPMQHKLKH